MARSAAHSCVWRILAHGEGTRVLVGCRCTKTKILKDGSGLPDMCCDERVR